MYHVCELNPNLGGVFMQFSLLNNTSSLSFRLLKSKYFPFFFLFSFFEGDDSR